jgi:hypothetical protein
MNVKLKGHHVADRLNMKHKKIVGGMAMRLVLLKNILMNLKRERQCNMNNVQKKYKQV